MSAVLLNGCVFWQGHRNLLLPLFQLSNARMMVLKAQGIRGGRLCREGQAHKKCLEILTVYYCCCVVSGSLKPKMAEAKSHTCWLWDTYMWLVPINLCCKSVCGSLVELLASFCKALLSSPTRDIKTGQGESYYLLIYFILRQGLNMQPWLTCNSQN